MMRSNGFTKSSSINQMVPGLPMFIGAVANLHNLNEILPEAYASASPVIIIIGLSKLIDMTAGINGAIILNSKYYRFDLISMIILIIFFNHLKLLAYTNLWYHRSRYRNRCLIVFIQPYQRCLCMVQISDAAIFRKDFASARVELP
ncbi:MAG: hypothetical protein U5K71_11200 [Gracilimonas sp.]|nr:hypothetical protein [Gracilimonas sp.]